MSNEEKAIYFAEADLHKVFHQLDNPGWTTKENYVSTCRPPIFKLEKDKMLRCHEVEQQQYITPLCNIYNARN